MKMRKRRRKQFTVRFDLEANPWPLPWYVSPTIQDLQQRMAEQEARLAAALQGISNAMRGMPSFVMLSTQPAEHRFKDLNQPQHSPKENLEGFFDTPLGEPFKEPGHVPAVTFSLPAAFRSLTPEPDPSLTTWRGAWVYNTNDDKPATYIDLTDPKE